MTIRNLLFSGVLAHTGIGQNVLTIRYSRYDLRYWATLRIEHTDRFRFEAQLAHQERTILFGYGDLAGALLHVINESGNCLLRLHASDLGRGTVVNLLDAVSCLMQRTNLGRRHNDFFYARLFVAECIRRA